MDKSAFACMSGSTFDPCIQYRREILKRKYVCQTVGFPDACERAV